MHKNNYLFLSAFILLLAASCKKKDDNLHIPPELAHFANQKSANFFVVDPAEVYKVPVGFTTVSGQDRTVTINISSPSGAQQGTHYSVSSTTVTIPAGKAVDSLTVTPVFAQYQAGRKDTLIFVITSPNPATYNDTFKLYMRGPCFEGEIATDLTNGENTSIVGSYSTIERTYNSTTGAQSGADYGPYNTSIKSATLTSPTTADIVVGNIWDAGWPDITFTLDWTDINNRTITLQTQNIGPMAGTVNSSYAGQDLTVGPSLPTHLPAPAHGTFSYCNGTYRLKFRMCIPNLGCFSLQVNEIMTKQ